MQKVKFEILGKNLSSRTSNPSQPRRNLEDAKYDKASLASLEHESLSRLVIEDQFV